MAKHNPGGMARLRAETHEFIARGDVEGLASALERDAAGTAQRLAERARSKRHKPAPAVDPIAATQPLCPTEPGEA